jgi:hypothetical protein
LAAARKDWRIQDYCSKENYWNKIDASNPKFLNTPLYTEHILEYLKSFMNLEMNFTEEEKTVGFKKCIDVIIDKLNDNEETQNFALQLAARLQRIA